MTANVRFSSHSVQGKTNLGGAAIQGNEGVYSPSNITTHLIFDEITKSENNAGAVDYRCLYVQNDYSNLTVMRPKIQFVSQTDVADFEIGIVDDKGVTAQAITNESVPPSGVSFSKPVLGSPIELIKGSVKNLAPGESVAFWLKRTAKNLGSSGTRSGELKFEIRYES